MTQPVVPSSGVGHTYTIAEFYTLARKVGFDAAGATVMTAIALRESSLQSHPKDNAAYATRPDGTTYLLGYARGILQFGSWAWPDIAGDGQTCAYDATCALTQAYTITSHGTNFAPWAVYPGDQGVASTDEANGTWADLTARTYLKNEVMPVVSALLGGSGQSVSQWESEVQKLTPNYTGSTPAAPLNEPGGAFQGVGDPLATPSASSGFYSGAIQNAGSTVASAIGLPSLTFLSSKTFWLRVGMVIIGAFIVFKAVTSIGEGDKQPQTQPAPSPEPKLGGLKAAIESGVE